MAGGGCSAATTVARRPSAKKAILSAARGAIAIPVRRDGGRVTIARRRAFVSKANGHAATLQRWC